MKLWVLVGALTIAAIPSAFADVDDSRHAVETRVEPAPATLALDVVRPAATQREAASAPAVRAEQPPVMTDQPAPRRRHGSRKRIPDAVLIGPRGAL